MKTHYCRDTDSEVLCGDHRATKGTVKWDDVNCLRCLHIGVKANPHEKTRNDIPDWAAKIRRLGLGYRFGWPGYQRTMRAEDICSSDHPMFDRLRKMELAHACRDIYASLAKTLLQAERPFIMIPDHFPITQCTCEGEGFGGWRHTKHCPRYVNPDFLR